MTPSELANLVAQVSLDARERCPSGRVRVAIDGPVADDAARLADAVADVLTNRAQPVARIRAAHWQRARSLRLEYGSDDPVTYLEGWFDTGALRREVLDPVAAPGPAQYLQRLRDPQTDRSVREARRNAPSGLVVVLDVPFLARWETRDAVDVHVLLDVTPAAQQRRVPQDEQARVLPAWAQYLQIYSPADAACLVVRYDKPRSPAVWHRREA